VPTVDVSSDGGPAPSRGEEGDGSDGNGSLRNIIDKIHSVASNIAASTEVAKVKIANADSNTQACVSLAGRLSGVLKTLTDVDSMLSDELAQIPTARHSTKRKDGDRKTFRWLYNVNDVGSSVSESSGETDRAAHQSKAVSVGDGKRSRVGTSSPAAAAAAAASSDGGCLIGVSGAPAATQQRGANTKNYGRPCLPGLPEGVMGHMGSFLTTMMATRLTRVNKETHQKATDETFGVFRHFSMTKDEEAKYQAIRKLREVKHLGKIRAAYVEASGVVQCVVELLERSAETLKELHVAEDKYPDSHEPYEDNDDTWGAHQPPQPRPSGDPTAFPSLERLNIQPEKWLGHISSIRRWALPQLRSLQVGRLSQYDTSSGCLTRLIKESPNVERLEAEMMRFDDPQWADFTAALGRCPDIKTITGLEIEMNQFSRLNQLKQALDQHWAKPERKDVPKRLEFVSEPNIGADCTQRAADLQVVGKWAAEVSCELEWRPRRWLLSSGGTRTRFMVDCSSDAGPAHPAPDGPYGEKVKQLAAEAGEVWLLLGGTPIHPSWRDKLVFSNATSLWLRIKASASGVVESIPTWLVERDGAGHIAASRSFPAVRHIDVSFRTLSLSDLPSAPSKLSRLVGGLAGLERVFFRELFSASVGCELLSYLSVPRLSEVDIAEPMSYEWPASVPAEWSFRSPRVERLVSPPLDALDINQWHSKEGVQSFLQLVSTLRAASVDFILC